MAIPDSSTLPLRLHTDVPIVRVITPKRPVSLGSLLQPTVLELQLSAYASPKAPHLPNAHCVLHSEVLLAASLGCFSSTAVPPTLKQLQGCHRLGVSLWIIPEDSLSGGLFPIVVFVVLVCFHCAGTTLWLGSMHPPP